MFWDFSISKQFPRHVDVSSEFKCNLYCKYDGDDGVMTMMMVVIMVMTMMMVMVMMVVIMMMMVMMEIKICDAVELRRDT